MSSEHSHAARVAGMLVLALVLGVFVIMGCDLIPGAEHKVSIPSTPPANSLVMFNLLPSGNPDAKFYARGFSRALADELDSPEHSLTLQVNPYGEDCPLHAQRFSSTYKMDQQRVLGVTKTLGARYGIAGDLRLTGDRVLITLHLHDGTAPSRPETFTATGKLGDLPAMQVRLAEKLVKAMKLEPDPEQREALSEANFSKPEALAMIGRSQLSKDYKQGIRFGWAAYKADPESSFCTIYLIGCYGGSKVKWRDIKEDWQLPRLLDDAAKRYPNNPDMKGEIAWVSAKQYEYAKAEGMLRDALKSDPKSASLNSMMAYVAMFRNDSDAACNSAEALVNAWPSSPMSHVELAGAYAARADARKKQSAAESASHRKAEWDSKAAYAEASAAVKLYRGSARAWTVVMDRSLAAGWLEYAQRAFDIIVRLDPQNITAYMTYATSLAGQHSQAGELDRVLSLADKNLEMKDAYMVRGWALLSGSPSNAQLSEVLKMATKIVKGSRDLDTEGADMACYALMKMGRDREVLEIAKRGFQVDPSPRWRALLSSSYTAQWKTAKDRAALDQATALMLTYVYEIPGDSYGHMLLGSCLADQGKREEAKYELRRALKLDPHNEAVKNRLKSLR